VSRITTVATGVLFALIFNGCLGSASTAAASTPASAQLRAPAATPIASPMALAAGKPGLTRSQILRLLSGIPQSGARLGISKAPVTLTLFGDLECPPCQAYALGRGFSTLVAKDVRAGRVRVIYRGFQTATPSARVFELQQVAALAAGEQHRFWQFALLFLHDQGAEGTSYVTESYLDGIAKQVPGLEVDRWKSAGHNPALAAKVRADERLGDRDGIVGTPTVILQGPRGKVQPITPVPGYRQLEKAIRAVE